MSQLTEHYPMTESLIQNSPGGSKTFGPLTINYSLDLSIPQVSANATLYGISIGGIVLNPEHPTASIGGSVGIAKAELKLTVDFSKKELDYDVDVEAFGKVLYKGSGKLFSW